MSRFFNHQMLQIARQARGLSQSELAVKLDINHGYMSKLEHGLLIPADDLIEKMGKVLEFPLSYFEQTDRIYGLPPSVHSGVEFGPKGYRHRHIY